MNVAGFERGQTGLDPLELIERALLTEAGQCAGTDDCEIGSHVAEEKGRLYGAPHGRPARREIIIDPAERLRLACQSHLRLAFR